MARFTVVLTDRNKNPHIRCFEDVAKALADALKQLGHELAPETNPGRLIIFGANNLLQDPQGPEIPADTIIFNAEQLTAVADPRYFMQGFVKQRQLTVWDYSLANVAALKKIGITRAVHCPIGYIPSMTKIVPNDKQDIDVLHYGSVGASRRREILDALDRTTLNVERLFNVYGAERDAYIARSKIVLNLRYYERGAFEIFRVSHLLANRACVVTEAGGVDAQLEEFAQKSCEYVARDKIVETCQRLAADARERQFIIERGAKAFQQTSFVDNIRRALELS